MTEEEFMTKLALVIRNCFFAAFLFCALPFWFMWRVLEIMCNAIESIWTWIRNKL